MPSSLDLSADLDLLSMADLTAKSNFSPKLIHPFLDIHKEFLYQNLPVIAQYIVLTKYILTKVVRSWIFLGSALFAM